MYKYAYTSASRVSHHSQGIKSSDFITWVEYSVTVGQVLQVDLTAW